MKSETLLVISDASWNWLSMILVNNIVRSEKEIFDLRKVENLLVTSDFV